MTRHQLYMHVTVEITSIIGPDIQTQAVETPGWGKPKLTGQVTLLITYEYFK